MRMIFRWMIIFAAGLFSGAKANASELPRVFLLDGARLQTTRQSLLQGDRALAALVRDANEALSVGPFSVMDKDVTPPSGDKHDFMSQGPYWWPNPDTPNGLPYVRRDGRRNPEIYRLVDDRHMTEMTDAVETLALAYYFTGKEVYATKAARLLGVWFLDPPTRMNPNLQYAQGIPGITTGRGTGLIDSVGLTRVVDAVGLLAGSESWTAGDQNGLQTWFGEYLQWMLESKNGRDEAAARNNHGTYYDLQVASYAMFVGRKDVATAVLREAATRRIARQIEPDGRQPLELERTRSWGYSLMNLRGLMSLARLGESAGVDLWSFQTEDGRSIRKALDYLLPFALGEKKWPYEQMGPWSPRGIFPLVRWAALKYPDGPYRSLLSKLPAPEPNDRTRLLRPDATEAKPPQGSPDGAAASAVPDARLDYAPGEAPRSWPVATPLPSRPVTTATSATNGLSTPRRRSQDSSGPRPSWKSLSWRS
jgi:hypothetical protein